MTDTPKDETPAELNLDTLEAGLRRLHTDIRSIPMVERTDQDFDAIIRPPSESTESAVKRPSLATRLARLFGYKS